MSNRSGGNFRNKAICMQIENETLYIVYRAIAEKWTGTFNSVLIDSHFQYGILIIGFLA